MKNTIISFLLFLSMIIALLFSVRYLNSVCIKLYKETGNIEDYINDGDWKKSYDASAKFLNVWENCSHKLSMFVDHSRVDVIDSELLKLTQYVKCHNKDESLASIHTIKFYLDHLYNLEKINIQNIL